MSVSDNEMKSAAITVPFNPCLAKLREGEPFFVLLGRDKQAPNAIMTWANDRTAAEGASAWTEQAREVAYAMAEYSGAFDRPSETNPPTTSSAPHVSASHNSGENLPNGDTAGCGAETNSPAAPAHPRSIDREALAELVARSLRNGLIDTDGKWITLSSSQLHGHITAIAHWIADDLLSLIRRGE